MNPFEAAIENERPKPARAPWPWVTLALVGFLGLIELAFYWSSTPWSDARSVVLEGYGQDRQRIWAGEYYRLITCTFLHGLFAHYFVNALALLLFGRLVERWLGPARFFGFYLLFAFGGSLSYQAFSSSGIGIGASGAICGLVGCFLVGRFGKRGVVLGADGRQYGSRHAVLGSRFWRWVAIITAVLLLESALVERSVPGIQVADSAHLGGLVAGLLAGAFFFSSGRIGVRRRIRTGLISFALLVGVGSYGLAFPVFDSGWYLWRVDRHLEEYGEDRDPDLIASLEERARYFGGDFAAIGVIQRKLARDSSGEEAYAYWKSRELEHPALQAEAGYLLYDRFHENGLFDVLPPLLDRMIALVDEALEGSPDNVALLNQGAWYRALQETDLDRALELARRALEQLPLEAGILNTLGWVYFKREEYEPAFKYLVRAVDVEAPKPVPWSADTFFEKLGEVFMPSPTAYQRQVLAPNYLYLALAYWERRDVTNARLAAIQARRVVTVDPSQLEGHELKLLTGLEESLARGPARPLVAPTPRESDEDALDDSESEGRGSGAGEVNRVE